MSTEHVMGNVLASRVIAALDKSLGQGTPKLVVADFRAEEVSHALERLESYCLGDSTEPITVVVEATDAQDCIPQRFRRLPGQSLTWHRNNNTSGLVLMLLTEASDKQGLGQMYRLTDRSILERTRDGDAPGADLVLSEAWNLSGEDGLARPPEVLSAELHRVLRGVTAREPMPVRPWVRYVHAVCSELRASGRALTASSVRATLGRQLAALGLFDHRTLFDAPSHVERHLERNRYLSEGHNPQGRAIPDDFLETRIQLVRHAGFEGKVLSEAEAEVLRTAMLRFALHRSEEARQSIDYVQWAALFDTSARREGLGVRVREMLESRGHELLDAFQVLDIEAALDDGDHEAAITLLDARTAEDEPLADVLPSGLRRRVERLAVPPSTLEKDPLGALLRFIAGDDDSTHEGQLALRLDPAQGETGQWSLVVYVMLYGRTLRELASQSALGTGTRLKVEPALTEINWPASAPPDEDDDDEASDAWAPVHLGLWIGDEELPRQRFQWSPDDRNGYSALVALIRGNALPNSPSGVSYLESLMEELEQAMLELVPGPREHPVGQDVAPRWKKTQVEYFRRWTSEGLDAESIDAYVESWGVLLQEARDTLVPLNAPEPRLDAFLDLDLVELADGHVVMLATHPLRLRWFAAHLRRLADDIGIALEGDFRLNSENDSLFFDGISRASAHRQPPVLVPGSNRVAASAREYGLHEEYAAITPGATAETWVGAVDDGAVQALTSTVVSYLDAFPHKRDGLGLLLLSRSGEARLPELLIRHLARSYGHDLVLELHVVAPRASHAAISLRFPDVGDERDRERLLLPPTRLVTHDWPEDFGPLLRSLEGRIDVALVPNLFGANTQLQAKTRPRKIGAPGSFDPWLDNASHTAPVGAGSGQNLSRVLLPAAPDPLLEAWSTTSVRRYLRSPVAPDQTTNTDFFILQVTFDQDRALFERLHEVAHWVVTLDPFVGREQVDALESPPDVILIRSGVGKNKTHTLVVSSRSGRETVTRGLDRKLRRNLMLVAEDEKPHLAERLYDLGRNTVPGVTLRALGLGRSLEEIIGLVVTRFAVQERYPVPDASPGVEWWISLDDHLPWFGGAHQLRADLLRVVALIEGESMELRLQVVESKFRTHEDIGIADQQLRRSISLFEQALSSSPDTSPAMRDTKFWRRELTTALDETSRRDLAAHDLPALRTFGDENENLIRQLRHRLLHGEYTLHVSGIACAQSLESTAAHVEIAVTKDGYPLIRMPRAAILDVLVDIEAARDPRVQREPGAETEPEVQEQRETPKKPAPSAPRRAPVRTDGTSQRGLPQAEMELRYQRVLDAMHEFRVDVEAPSGDRYDQGPAIYLVRLVPGRGTTADKLMARTTDLKLRLGLSQGLDIRTYADRGAVVFEIPKEPAERYSVDAGQMWRTAPAPDDRLVVAVGENIAGDVMTIDLSSSESPHLLIAGTTGSGKSVALETILEGLCQSKPPTALRLHLVDPKGTELSGFEDSDHLAGEIGMDADDAIATLEAAVEEMQRRYALFKPRRVRDLASYNAVVEPADRRPWWIVVLDEYADLTADPGEKREIEALLRRLAQKARAAGIHLIIATQRPSADVISPVVRSNLPAQLALRVRTATDSRVILDEAGAETLAGSGDALLRTARGTTRIQSGMVRRAT